MKTKQAQTSDEKIKDNPINKEFVQEKILEINGKPKNFSHVNAVNVFDNRWRVNVYTQEDGFIKKKRIQASYFCVISEDKFISYKESGVMPK